LIDRGYLSPFRTFCPAVPDLAGVRRRMGEFVQSELVARVDRPGITGNAIDHYAKHVEGRQAVAFCVSVEHAHHVAEQFRAALCDAACLDGSMPRDWRRDIVRDFKARRLRVLTSCDLISEGFDCPGIEVGISLRPTQSLGLWLQQMGRCLRTSPGKAEAVLLDCAGNALRHGLPTEPRQWTLNGSQTKKADDSGPKPRVCPKCWAYMRSSARACLGCGHVFEVTPRTVPKRDGELFEVTADELAAARKKEQQKETQDFFALKTLAMNRGYKNPDAWAKRVLAQAAAKKARQVSV
jgi:superfamily II DNA or RNA helicase